MAMTPKNIHSACLVKYVHEEPVSLSATTDEADSTMTRPMMLSTTTTVSSSQKVPVSVPGGDGMRSRTRASGTRRGSRSEVVFTSARPLAGPTGPPRG